MGCFEESEGKVERNKSKVIDTGIQKEKVALKNEVKMLLLGTGESGKSTVLKQMKLMYDKGFSLEEREGFRMVIFSNTYQSMRCILEAMTTMEIGLADPANEEHRATIMGLPSHQLDEQGLLTGVAKAIKALWGDDGVQAAYARSSEYQLNDSASYYFESIDRIASPDFMPTDQDVLRSRVKTTGIAESTFHIGELVYRLYDVGGQRSERRKWIHCFEKVTAVVFLVAISEYDQHLVEDKSVNRIQEALALFDSICNSRWFVKANMILFLNKIDLFKEKIQKVPLSNYFEDYKGGSDYKSASEYMAKRFRRLNQSPTKDVFVHFTCATDTSAMKFVLDAVNVMIFKEKMLKTGLM
ncbi:guanine nucleotide-binding protein subunit alpha [Thoreauomyces humboldtii]|nr:guanine nucleotide-binding protein subunit alpha [Thoreauomyces humboldtii]